jgi:hypothetical protein
LIAITDIILDKLDPAFGPTFITVNVLPTSRVIDTKLHTAPVNQHLKPTSKLLESKQGMIVHKFEVDGEASICVRASSASAKNPMRFGMRVRIVDFDPMFASKDKVDLDSHLGAIELEMKRIQAGMKHILSEADFAKDRDLGFHKVRVDLCLVCHVCRSSTGMLQNLLTHHIFPLISMNRHLQQTLAMHSSMTFWPILQAFVLIATGFAQASHIVHFFKSRRII